MSKGIDYGMGQANIDHETGIRYGIIPLRSLGEWSMEQFESDYGDPHCPDCGDSVFEDDGKYRCVQHGVVNEDEMYPESPIGWNLDTDGYVGWLDESNDVWLVKSPFKARAGFCSPCAPGAVYLTTKAEDGEWAYCFGPEWFDEKQEVPYRVFRVDTGEEVEQEQGRERERGQEKRGEE